MSVKSVHHALARIKILEGKLVNKDRINRMIESETAEEAFRILQESSYGAGADANTPREFEKMIANEMKELRTLINEISPDEELTDIFLMRYDYKNSKAYLKMQMTSTDVNAAVSDAGKVPARELREMVFQKDTVGLPKHLSDAITAAERQIAVDPNPSKVDNIMDRHYISWAESTAKRKNNAFLIKYFTMFVDLNNILSLLRVRQMEADTSLLKDTLLDGGAINKDFIIDAYPLGDDMLPLKFKNTVYGYALVEAMEKAVSEKRAWSFERFTENMLIECAKEQKIKVFGIEPVLSYIIAKENEATAIRMVMTGKTNKLDADQIRGRLRELYV